MRKVLGYETEDGKFFLDKKEAKRHEKALMIKEMEEFLSNSCLCSNYTFIFKNIVDKKEDCYE